MEEKIAKLPKWARDHIGVLEMRLREAERAFANATKPREQRRQYWPAVGDYGDNEGRELPTRRVRFQDFGVTVSASKDGVHISGDSALVINPQVTNAIYVRAERVDREP